MSEHRSIKKSATELKMPLMSLPALHMANEKSQWAWREGNTNSQTEMQRKQKTKNPVHWIFVG